MAQISAEVRGLDDLVRRASAKALLHPPVRTFFQRATQTVHLAAFQRTPRVTGTLQRSLATAVDPSALPLWGRVGTNVVYAPFIEFGSRQGKGGVVSRRAGPARMLRDGLDQSLGALAGLIGQATAEIEALWQR